MAMTLTVLTFLLVFVGNITALATAARAASAFFSRDQGVPFSKRISWVKSAGEGPAKRAID